MNWERYSSPRGAEICGVTRTEFLRILGEHKVSVSQYDEESFDRELA
jgi:predicted HTH domain antitoxin